jgi:hypothetical protein
MMEYRIVVAGSVEALAAAVNALIADGWKPAGGLCSLDNQCTVAQAMTKE